MESKKERTSRISRIAWPVLIVLVSASFGLFVDARAPGIGRYARDWLTRMRGPLPAPGDIAIVAIDEPSMARFGRFPWPRSILARALDAVAAQQPRAIAVDVLFTDPTTPDDDAALSHAIAKAGNAVVAAQLADPPFPGAPVKWLLPLPEIERSAAGVGHINVLVESEGVGRELLVREADDSGRALRALAIETVRVGQHLPEQAVTTSRRVLLLGSQSIPLTVSPRPEIGPVQEGETQNTPQILDAGRMAIDYIGPPGSFTTYSVLDVLGGRAAALAGKYVLIGATAASTGDRLSSPFAHFEDARGNQHGSTMPGVEVLANAVNTLLRSRFYSETPDWAAFLWAALAAAVTLFLLSVAQGRQEWLTQAAVLVAVPVSIVFVGYLAFSKFLIVPPLTPVLFSFAAAGLLGIARRSTLASLRLDHLIAAITAELNASGSAAESSAWPRGLEKKALELGALQAQVAERRRFVDSALRASGDGLILAAPDGRIRFANPSAAAILHSTSEALVGRSLFEQLQLADPRFNAEPEPAFLNRVLLDRAPYERELAVAVPPPAWYLLRIAAISGKEKAAIGLVASLSDVTRQHELQRAKNDVVALVSHEMRTPLTAVQGMSELLARYDVDPAQRRELATAINEETLRLSRMIGVYLDLARLEAGADVLRLAPLLLAPLVERAVLLLDPLAQQRDIRLVRCIAENIPPFLADADLLSQAISNLVSNAIKYSPAGTEVVISAQTADSQVVIEVQDHGYGIPEADRERIFEKFYRVPRLEDAGVPGTGLGLALVREIVTLHRGVISLSSHVNAGSTFRIVLPI